MKAAEICDILPTRSFSPGFISWVMYTNQGVSGKPVILLSKAHLFSSRISSFSCSSGVMTFDFGPTFALGLGLGLGLTALGLTALGLAFVVAVFLAVAFLVAAALVFFLGGVLEAGRRVHAETVKARAATAGQVTAATLWESNWEEAERRVVVVMRRAAARPIEVSILD